ncbi:MAG TPA: NAD-dependent epimerase/dehydratase family protein [Pseudolabrys sp.]|nr:NAD-dependent epimerase/dehydratase family protein [Pseudolabrys sp.]
MRIFLAGAGGAIGRRLTPLLVKSGHQVAGTTRSAEKADAIRALGAEPVVVDVFDAEALKRAVVAAKPDAVIHQLTDLAFAPGTPQYAEGLKRNARIRVEGTPNLAAAARAAGVRRLIAQSIAFIYADGPGARVETDPMAKAEGAMAGTIPAVKALEDAVLALPEGIVLRYGYFYGPGTWSPDGPTKRPCVHVDAAAQACAAALIRGEPGLYNVAEDDPTLSSEKAKRLLGFEPDFRLTL